MSVSIVIPAAGTSSRMRGTDKLMTLVDGCPLLRLVVERACTASNDVVVALPAGSKRRSIISDLDAKLIDVQGANQGMGTSIKAAVSHISEHATGVMVLPADMPDLTANDLSMIIQHFDKKQKITRGCAQDGTEGHPVLFPVSFLNDLLELSGDQGARVIIQGHPIELVTLGENRALVDLDTPEDWDHWRKRHAGA